MLLAARIPTISLAYDRGNTARSVFSGIQPDDPATRAPLAGKGGAQMAKRSLLTRRDFIKAAGIGAVAMGAAPTIFLPRQAHGASKELKILVWSHFVPRFDKEWSDGYVQKWGEANGVKVTVDHINLAEIPSRTAARDLRRPGTRPDRMDRAPVAVRAERPRPRRRRQGGREALRETAPTVPRKLLQPEHEEVLLLLPRLDDRPRLLPEEPLGEGRERDRAGDVGRPDHVRREDQEGPGDPARRRLVPGARLEHGGPGLLWSYDTSIQDKKENVVLNNPKTIEAVSYMARLFKESMVPEVFAWTAVSNNQALIAGRASVHPQLHFGIPLRAAAGPRDRQGHLLHPRPQGAPRDRVQLRARDLLLRGPQVFEERRQREEIPPRPGRELRPGDVQERTLQLPRLLRRPHPFRGPRLPGREGGEETRRPSQRLVHGRPVRPPRGGEGEARRPQGRREVERQPRVPRPGESGRGRGLRDLRPAEHDGQRRPRDGSRDGGGAGNAPDEDHLRQVAQEGIGRGKA